MKCIPRWAITLGFVICTSTCVHFFIDCRKELIWYIATIHSSILWWDLSWISRYKPASCCWSSKENHRQCSPSEKPSPLCCRTWSHKAWTGRNHSTWSSTRRSQSLFHPTLDEVLWIETSEIRSGWCLEKWMEYSLEWFGVPSAILRGVQGTERIWGRFCGRPQGRWSWKPHLERQLQPDICRGCFVSPRLLFLALQSTQPESFRYLSFYI